MRIAASSALQTLGFVVRSAQLQLECGDSRYHRRDLLVVVQGNGFDHELDRIVLGIFADLSEELSVEVVWIERRQKIRRRKKSAFVRRISSMR